MARMSGTQVPIRYTYYYNKNPETDMSGSIVFKYLRDKYPDKGQIEVTEVIWK